MSALTGVFGKAGNTENDTSQYVDATKPDFPHLAHGWAQELHDDGLRFAPGYDPQRNVDSVITVLQRSGQRLHSLVQVTGVKGHIADAAACTWESSWVSAYQGHDPAGMTAATAGMRQTATLKIMSQINAATWLTGLANDADRGDAGPIQADVTVNCTTVVK